MLLSFPSGSNAANFSGNASCAFSGAAEASRFTEKKSSTPTFAENDRGWTKTAAAQSIEWPNKSIKVLTQNWEIGRISIRSKRLMFLELLGGERKL